jgi:hypothetical protein
MHNRNGATKFARRKPGLSRNEPNQNWINSQNS